MASEPKVITIDSILGGHSPLTNFAAEDQFFTSLGIDPALGISSTSDGFNIHQSMPSGLLRPVAISGVGTTISRPHWFVSTPKSATSLFVYDSSGSVYTVDNDFSAVTGLGDLNDGGTSGGNGAAYYDNYVYFARDTTVARYGPLDGTPAFTDDYWVGTLGKTALTDTTYPSSNYFGLEYPNHFLHRHSDGKLYVADVVGNRGTIHFIQTTKTAVEGDTDAGSTYGRLQVGPGLWPTAMESYGSNLVISFCELKVYGSDKPIKSDKAKVAFWDTTSTNVNQITWVEYPDQLITAIKNVNGTIYFTSSNQNAWGFRLMRYVGGNSFEEVAYIPTGDSPFPGAVDAESNRLLFGGFVYQPSDDTNLEESGCVYSYGLAGLKVDGLFNTIPVRGHNPDNIISKKNVFTTAVKLIGNKQYGLYEETPIIGYSGNGMFGVVVPTPDPNGDNDLAPCYFWSKKYKIGRPFKIKKIGIPLAQAIQSGMTVTPKVFVDDGAASYSVGTNSGLATINDTNYHDKRRITFSPENMTGEHNFWLEFEWTGTRVCTLSLPITIEYELLND